MNVRIQIAYKTPKGLEASFVSEELRAEKAIIIAEDLEKTGRIKQLNFSDSQDSTWTIKELKKFLKGIETEPHDATIYFDGGFDLQSQKSGLGCVIYYQQNGKSYRLRKNALIDSLDSNNEAEYAALYFCLNQCEALGIRHQTINIFGDSQVVINQMKGEWPCAEAELNKWGDRIETKLEQLGLKPSYEFVSRKGNQEADQLASQALRDIEISGTIEVPGK